MMQLLSTVLVVPIVQSIAESLNCVRPVNPRSADRSFDAGLCFIGV